MYIRNPQIVARLAANLFITRSHPAAQCRAYSALCLWMKFNQSPKEENDAASCMQNLRNRSDYASLIPIAKYEEVKDLPNHPEKLLIDVREPEELKETGKIPTSINIPLGIVSQELDSSISQQRFKAKYGRIKPQHNDEVIFHCKSGKRSLKAAVAATTLGYSNVKNYEGSWLDWAEREGLPK